MFIKLGPKHASTDKIELAVFEVLRKFWLGVPDLGLLLAVLGSKLRLVVPSFVQSVGYSVHTCNQTINTSAQFFLKTTVGQSPPATNIFIKGKNQKLTKSLKRGRGKKAPNQQLGLGEVYQMKTTQKKRISKKLEELYPIWPQKNLKCTDAESF
jgi:hypothetical protein